jgi:ATP-dependent DNA ligase
MVPCHHRLSSRKAEEALASNLRGFFFGPASTTTHVSRNQSTQVHRAAASLSGRTAAGGEALDSRIKHDGYRSQLVIERDQVRVFNRNGYDWSDRYPSIVRAAAKLPCKSAIIDGEAIVQNGNGASDFGALQSAMRRQPHSIVVYAFDLLHLDGKGDPSRKSPRASSILEGFNWR